MHESIAIPKKPLLLALLPMPVQALDLMPTTLRLPAEHPGDQGRLKRLEELYARSRFFRRHR